MKATIRSAPAVCLHTLLLAACTTPPGTTPGTSSPPLLYATARAMKGVELVSWRTGDGQWHYALVAGTNRLKSRDEIVSTPSQANDVSGLKTMLSALPAGQSIVWQGLPGDDAFLPPGAVVDEISSFAAARKLTLTMAAR